MINQPVILAFLSLMILGTMSCGDSDCQFNGDLDARCQELCKYDVFEIDGAGQICTQSSVETCKALCQTRIEGLETVCQTCLLENADFAWNVGCFYHAQCDDPPTGRVCGLSQGGIYPPVFECEYPEGDDAQMEACYRQLCPREEIDCVTEFDDVADCVDFCGVETT